MINGANGNPGVPAIGTISAIAGNTFTLAGANATASATASNCQAVYGTDDTAAINAAVTAGNTYALANNYFFQVLLAAKIYIVAGLTQSNIGGTIYNTQIPVPFPNANGQTRKILCQFTGAGYLPGVQYWESLEPNAMGTALMSMRFAPSTLDATFGKQSVIGGVTSATLTGSFMNTHLTLLNMSVWCGAYTNIKAIDGTFLSGMHLDGYHSNIFAPANNLAGAAAAHPYLSDFVPQSLFQNSIGIGIVWPNSANNDALTFGDIAVEGYEVGMDNAQDHLTGNRYAALYCDVCIRSNPSQSHELSIQSVNAEQYNGGLRINGTGGAVLKLNIGWDGEVTAPVYDVSDTSNIATGVFRWIDLFHSVPVITGASALKVINEKLGPGHWAGAPAVPASTVAQQNTAWRDAWVVIHDGAGVTVTVITVDGTVTGLTAPGNGSVAVRVPSGKNIVLTYSGGTPTWDWWLD
jgi:hypothetical protein